MRKIEWKNRGKAVVLIRFQHGPDENLDEARAPVLFPGPVPFSVRTAKNKGASLTTILTRRTPCSRRGFEKLTAATTQLRKRPRTRPSINRRKAKKPRPLQESAMAVAARERELPPRGDRWTRPRDTDEERRFNRKKHSRCCYGLLRLATLSRLLLSIQPLRSHVKTK